MNNEIMWSTTGVYVGESDHYLCIVARQKYPETFRLICHTKGYWKNPIVHENLKWEDLIDKITEFSEGTKAAMKEK